MYGQVPQAETVLRKGKIEKVYDCISKVPKDPFKPDFLIFKPHSSLLTQTPFSP